MFVYTVHHHMYINFIRNENPSLNKDLKRHKNYEIIIFYFQELIPAMQNELDMSTLTLNVS